MLSNAQEVESLTPFQCRRLIDLADGRVHGQVHKITRRLINSAVTGAQSGTQSCRDAENAQEHEHGDRAVVLPYLLEEALFRKEAELEVLGDESLNAVENLLSRRKAVLIQLRRPGGACCCTTGGLLGSLCGVASVWFGDPDSWVAVDAVQVWLASHGKDAISHENGCSAEGFFTVNKSRG